MYLDASNSRTAFFRLLSHIFPERRNTLRQYLYVTVLMTFALAARLVIAPLNGGIQYVTFFPAVALSAIVGGLWPGLFAAMVGMAMATYFFWPPYTVFAFEFNHHMVISNGVFLVDAVVVCSAIEAMHAYYKRFVEMEKKLRLAARVVQHAVEGIMVTDGDSRIISVNPAFTDITGYEAVEAVGKRPSLLRSNRHDAAFYSAMWEALRLDKCWQGEIWNRRKNGEAYLEWLSINRIDDERGYPVNYVAMFHDVTEFRKHDEHIKHLAYHDGLTGLPNRTLFQDRLQHAVERARRDGNRLLVAFVDLDRFKEVNDTLGHEVGDLLLQKVGERIKGQLRESDTVARLGGDEFVILLESWHQVENCISLAEALISDLARPMALAGHDIQIGASIGLAYFPEHGSEAQELLKHADAAMYAAKEAGRNACRIFEPEMLNHHAGLKSGQ